MEYNNILYGEIKFVPHSIQNNINLNHHQNASPTKKKTIATTNGTTNGNGLNGSSSLQSTASTCNNNNDIEASFRGPKHNLCDPNLIKLDWTQSDKIGGGLINVGNTCFLNSVLQCLTYCAPLYNYLIKHNGGHSNTCKLNQYCMLCEMEKHIKRIKSSNGTPIKPISIVHRLKYINKSFQFGRQEDAHEFLRYLIDHMWKACLMNLDINVKSNNSCDRIDPRIKETTAINHIFGGYHRSQVLCLSCNSRSNTFDFFMDFILDISNAKSLEDSLRKFMQPETLEHENAYKCGRCKRKVTAKKRFSVYKAPNVATFQLKRFDSDRIYGGKLTKYVSYPEELDLRPYMSDSTKLPIKYQLSAVLVHVGHSSNSGHYFCFTKNSNGLWYRMDDSNVTVVNRGVVLQQQAYILFYTKKSGENGKSSLNYSGATKISSMSSDTITDNKSSNDAKKIITNGLSQNGNGKSHTEVKKCPETTSVTSPNKTSSVKPPYTSLTTWLGNKSKLEDEDSGKRKLNTFTERDIFNEEIDRGKTKKIKSQNRDEKFNILSKSNPFQRFNGTKRPMKGRQRPMMYRTTGW